jgi:hypothetical protein
MKSSDHLQSNAETYFSVRALSEVFAYVSSSEGERGTAISGNLSHLLGRRVLTAKCGFPVPSFPDGVIRQLCGPSTAYLPIVEVLNEIGSGLSDPYTLASLAYRKFWAQESRMLTECLADFNVISENEISMLLPYHYPCHFRSLDVRCGRRVPFKGSRTTSDRLYLAW